MMRNDYFNSYGENHAILQIKGKERIYNRCALFIRYHKLSFNLLTNANSNSRNIETCACKSAHSYAK